MAAKYFSIKKKSSKSLSLGKAAPNFWPVTKLPESPLSHTCSAHPKVAHTLNAEHEKTNPPHILESSKLTAWKSLYLLAAVESLTFFPSNEAKCCSRASRRLLGAWRYGNISLQESTHTQTTNIHAKHILVNDLIRGTFEYLKKKISYMFYDVMYIYLTLSVKSRIKSQNLIMR